MDNWEKDLFQACTTCSAKPGMPILCTSCLHNREVISRLSKDKRHLASALMKFAPDLMEELIKRHGAADQAFEDFLTFMKKE